MYRMLLLLCIAGFFTACRPALPDDVQAAYEQLPDRLDYNMHVKPVLSDKCFACHGPDKARQKAGLRLDIAEAAYGELPENPGKTAIHPGNLKKSEFFHRIISDDPTYKMPSPESHLSLTAEEKAILIRWIEEGAVYKPHWAFVAPEKPELPKLRNESAVVNPIDRFVFARLEKEHLTPSAPAERELLLRRVSLDLTGLPPTPEAIDSFVKDPAPDAYEKQVDRLLASVHYGEKQAVHWLDLARFADSHGYTVDRLRDMSPYRDWVIRAFNRNMPYDRFLHEQLAGDLMPHPGRDMLIATAFNRNHPQNAEGGIIEEEFQTEYVIDRTNTFGEAMLGLSLGCARCHDHKYDPVSQKNYYQLFSYFNNVREAGQISWDDATPSPTLLLPSPVQEAGIRAVKARIEHYEHELWKAAAETPAEFGKWLTGNPLNRMAEAAIPLSGLQGYYTFDKQSLKSNVKPGGEGIMKHESGLTGDKPVYAARENGYALKLDGDVYLDLENTGIFRKSDPFTIGIRVFIPKALKEGVIFHKSIAERLYNFRGYHLYLKDDRLEINLAYAAPSNAITRVSAATVPKDEWVHLTMTYDGSSRASGMRLYLNGTEMPTKITMDRLTKDILFRSSQQPGLQVGGWWRGLGLKDGLADDIAVYNRELTPAEIKVLAGKATWSEAFALEKGAQTPQARAHLLSYYQANVSTEMRSLRDSLSRWRAALSDSTWNIPEIMIMEEMPRRKKAFVLLRGEYDNKGEEVFPDTPEALLPFPKELPKNRLGLARWLTHEKHPLTARVAVNRFWQNLFGTGLVKTSEDFGNQGALPSHPELLDWLAVYFRESGWDVKKLHKLMVMSATYRQDSRTSPALRENDPENRLLARGPSKRLTAEMIRDNALKASGLLNAEVGGKSIKPYQPAGLWEINSARYVPDSGHSLYRRSLYVVTKRSVPNPTLATFDATSRSYCVIRRQQTNTPLQALVTLNDPTFTECARVMGEKMSANVSVAQAVTWARRQLTGKAPSPKELQLLLDLFENTVTAFKKQPAKATGWLREGQYRISPQADPARVAAFAVVASTILNSDATLTLR